jgi:Protein of unknown function (DUF642)/PEP-CTERM motif
MRSSIACGGLIAAGVLAATSAYAGGPNLVTNGDFANIGNVWVNNTGLGSDDWRTSGATAIPDWSNVAAAANEFWVTSPNGYGLEAAPGNASSFFVDLTGQANDKPYGGLEQTITTTPGTAYTLTFALGSSADYNNSGAGAAALYASATGTVLLASSLFTLAPTSTNTWATETLSFTANSASTTIEFLGDSGYTSEYTGLDNVSVTAQSSTPPPSVPEPASLTLLMLGLGGLGAARWRRRSDNH